MSEKHGPQLPVEAPDGTQPASGRTYTSGEVARLYGITVRTLHHWDAIGLASPSARTWAGHRIYTDADVDRVRDVLVYRETGMDLERIRQVLERPGDARSHLRAQLALLRDKAEHLQSLMNCVHTLLEEMTMSESPLTTEEKAALFGEAWSAEYEAEAEQRWGNTPDWAEAQRRQARMTAADWRRTKEEVAALEARLADALARGVVPGSAEANGLAEAHRQELARWFDVTVAKQVLIARGYTADPRFAAHYEQVAPGLAAWLVEVINANARAQGIDPAQAQWA
ncbi:MerR family transcriptional regulator [Buchananella hordeovulneris]|uniref:MerR family transcriptional regulator n=1 Tax=Buchananella hordeovulneris TaxID=52770 RepID=UPI000F5DC5A0|nr:MerR family transcriptional regulator [Buchananella hordeovulneris]RRD45329.1 MerR family transcriptional regulator [Buchananella hordeovulneris]